MCVKENSYEKLPTITNRNEYLPYFWLTLSWTPSRSPRLARQSGPTGSVGGPTASVGGPTAPALDVRARRRSGSRPAAQSLARMTDCDTVSRGCVGIRSSSPSTSDPSGPHSGQACPTNGLPAQSPKREGVLRPASTGSFVWSFTITDGKSLKFFSKIGYNGTALTTLNRNRFFVPYGSHFSTSFRSRTEELHRMLVKRH